MEKEQTEKLFYLIERIASAEERKADAARSIARLADIAYYVVAGLVLLTVGTIVIGLLTFS